MRRAVMMPGTLAAAVQHHMRHSSSSKRKQSNCGMVLPQQMRHSTHVQRWVIPDAITQDTGGSCNNGGRLGRKNNDCACSPPDDRSMELMYSSVMPRGITAPIVPQGVDSVCKYTGGAVRSLQNGGPSLTSPGHRLAHMYLRARVRVHKVPTWRTQGGRRQQRAHERQPQEHSGRCGTALRLATLAAILLILQVCLLTGRLVKI